MKAQEIMSANPTCVTPDSPVQIAARLMQSENVGVIPVVESESSKKLIGVVTDRDIAIRVVGEGKGSETPVSEVMSKNIKSHRPSDSINQVMDTMANEQVRRVPIVDDRGALVGIVSQADVVLESKNDQKAEQTIEKISEPGPKGRT